MSNTNSKSDTYYEITYTGRDFTQAHEWARVNLTSLLSPGALFTGVPDHCSFAVLLVASLEDVIKFGLAWGGVYQERCFEKENSLLDLGQDNAPRKFMVYELATQGLSIRYPVDREEQGACLGIEYPAAGV